jgi:CheY-like chemotaxis protein
MTTVLGRAGYRVLSAPDGPRGLECLTADCPDIVLVDLLMPGMDGLEFCRRLRPLPGLAALPIVLFTAMASAEIRLQAHAAGADLVILKPFERTALLDELACLLDRDRAGTAGDAHVPTRFGR